MPLTIPVIYGSVRHHRQGIGAARWIKHRLEQRGHEAPLIDPMAVGLPLLDMMYKEYKPGQAPAALEELAELYRRSDAFLICSGEYNHSPPPALTNLLDHFLEEYFFRPSAIACYSAGSFGGVRAAMQLRALLAEIGMPSISSLLPIPKVCQAFEVDGTPKDPTWNERGERFFAELEWYAEALKAHRRAHGAPW